MTAMVHAPAATTTAPARTSSGAGRTLLAIAGLLATLPVDALVVGVALLTVRRGPRVHHRAPRTILITGAKMTKALQLARSFHLGGHRVILVESAKYRFTGHRLSRAVDRFYVVPEPSSPGYAEALRDIV